MANSRDLAALIGPALAVIAVTEGLNLRIFANNAPAVVYLNGTILFVAGLAVVRAHNRWSFAWPLAVTLTGWLLTALGLWRMAFPEAQAAVPEGGIFTGVAIALALGCFLTLKAYFGRDHHTQP